MDVSPPPLLAVSWLSTGLSLSLHDHRASRQPFPPTQPQHSTGYTSAFQPKKEQVLDRRAIYEELFYWFDLDLTVTVSSICVYYTNTLDSSFLLLNMRRKCESKTIFVQFCKEKKKVVGKKVQTRYFCFLCGFFPNLYVSSQGPQAKVGSDVSEGDKTVVFSSVVSLCFPSCWLVKTNSKKQIPLHCCHNKKYGNHSLKFTCIKCLRKSENSDHSLVIFGNS